MDTGYLTLHDSDFEAFRALIGQTLDPATLRFATRIERNVPVYDMTSLSHMLDTPDDRRALLSEWAFVLGNASGALALKHAYPDTAPIDAATTIYNRIIADENARADGGADHFATKGANDRIWNSLEKLCLADPEVFALYFGNPVIAAVSEAWLGPNSQMTAQVNLVRPGGGAQRAHRDYHLGFQTADGAARYPAQVHALSAALTLQGAVAHSDMPVESGPTKMLPFSQLFLPGYLAYHQEAYRALFEEHHVQVPLEKGDALFFNPALFHAAGANTSADIQRMANLLQVSSAFGIAMERIDRQTMSARVFPVLKNLAANGRMTPLEIDAAISATGDGYAFPTSLDTDPPVNGLAPESQADLMRRALREDWDAARFMTEMQAQTARRRA